LRAILCALHIYANQVICVYTLDQLERWLDANHEPVLVRRGQEQNPFTRGADNQAFKPPINVEQRLRDMVVGGDGDAGVHATQLSVTASLMARNVDEDEIVRTVLKATQELPNTGGWDWAREERTIREMCVDFLKKYPREESIGPVSLADAMATRSKGDNLPVIQVRAGELPEVAKRAEEILVVSNVPIYQCGGMLVRPVIETVDASHGR
jgi:hypothetical protein